MGRTDREKDNWKIALWSDCDNNDVFWQWEEPPLIKYTLYAEYCYILTKIKLITTLWGW